MELLIVLSNFGVVLVSILLVVNDWHSNNAIVKIVHILAPTHCKCAAHGKHEGS